MSNLPVQPESTQIRRPLDVSMGVVRVDSVIDCIPDPANPSTAEVLNTYHVLVLADDAEIWFEIVADSFKMVPSPHASQEADHDSGASQDASPPSAAGLPADETREDSSSEGLVGQFVAHEQLVGYSPRTIDRRRNTIELFMRTLDGAEPTMEAVETFLAARPSQESRRSYLGDLRRFYGWAVSRELVQLDPTIGIQTPRVPVRDPTPLTLDEVKRVRAACRDRQDRIVIGLGLFAGLRVSEMAHLTGRDVRLDEGVLVVRSGKGGKDRRVPLAPALKDELAIEVLEAGTRDGVSRRIKRIFNRAGVTARPHDLRATFATELARKSNGNMQLVAGLCGHASMQTTRRYVGWVPDGSDIVNQLHAATAAEEVGS